MMAIKYDGHLAQNDHLAPTQLPCLIKPIPGNSHNLGVSAASVVPDPTDPESNFPGSLSHTPEDPYAGPRSDWATAAPDPDNPDHAVALKALEGDVPPQMALAVWWFEQRWEKGAPPRSPDTLPSMPLAATTTTGS
jgi:hypothetical protein